MKLPNGRQQVMKQGFHRLRSLPSPRAGQLQPSRTGGNTLRLERRVNLVLVHGEVGTGALEIVAPSNLLLGLPMWIQFLRPEAAVGESSSRSSFYLALAFS